jgi:hypothetical protein
MLRLLRLRLLHVRNTLPLLLRLLLRRRRRLFLRRQLLLGLWLWR